MGEAKATIDGKPSSGEPSGSGARGACGRCRGDCGGGGGSGTRVDDFEDATWTALRCMYRGAISAASDEATCLSTLRCESNPVAIVQTRSATAS